MAPLSAKTLGASMMLAAGAAIGAAAAPAQAIVLNQTVGPVAFSMTGNTASTASLVFAPFTAGDATSLRAVKIGTSSTGVFGGTISIISLVAGTQTFSVTASPQFIFSYSGTTVISGTPSAITLSPSSAAGVGTLVSASVSGTYAPSSYGSLATTSSALQTYFTGSPTINSYLTSYNVTSVPTGGASAVATTTFGGNLYLTYEYEGPAPVPAPSLIVGAGAAFAHFRRLRSNSNRLRAGGASVDA